MTQVVPPLDEHVLVVFLFQLSVLIAAATGAGRLARRLRMPPVVGELFAGVLLGPSVLQSLWPAVPAWVVPVDDQQLHLLDAVGQVGVLLLVALAGSELEVRVLRRYGRAGATVSAFGLVVPMALGFAAGLLLVPASMLGGVGRVPFALFLGVALSVSAVPVIARVLTDLRLLHRDISQLVLVTAMVDDAVAWVLLALVTALVTTGVSAASVVAPLVGLVVLLVASLLVGPVLRVLLPALRTAPRVGTVVVLVLLASAGTHVLGLGSLLGAFVCGVLLGHHGRLTAVELTALRTVVLGLLAPVFFATAGLRCDLGALADPEVLTTGLLVLAVAVVGKFAGAFCGALLARMDRWEAFALGAALNARGAVEIIIGVAGLRLGVLTTETFTLLVLVALSTSVVAAPLFRMAASRIAETDEERARLLPQVPEQPGPRVAAVPVGGLRASSSG